MLQPYDLPLEELQKYKPKVTKQPDFDEFWEQTLKELEAIPYEYTLTPYNYPVFGVRVYRISFLSFGNATIDGWIAMPSGNGPFPGLVLYHGYNWAFDGNLHDTVNWALADMLLFQMLCRGQQGNSVDNIVSSSGSTSGWMSKGIQSKNEYYYRAVYMDAVRAIEVLSKMEEVDETRIGLTGGSQGGGLTSGRSSVVKYS